MHRLEIEAIRALPEAYVRDGTVTAEFNGRVIAINPEQPPIVYVDGKGWEVLGFDAFQAVSQSVPNETETRA